MVNYTVNGDVLTVFDEDFVPVSIDKTHPNYMEVMFEIDADLASLDEILELMKPIEKVRKAVDGTSLVVTESQVIYNGQPLHGVIVDRILDGDRVDHLIAFLGKLMNNPSYRAVNELCRFLEKHNHAILSDGNFVAYKIVRSDYKDLHSGTFDNSPGKTVSVPRNLVDEDCNRTCSHGLHVCGFEYLDKYGNARKGSDRVVSVSINPADVVAVPTDYNNAKMRVCSYIVLKDITDRTDLWVGQALTYSDYEYDCDLWGDPKYECDFNDEDMEDEYEWDSESREGERYTY